MKPSFTLLTALLLALQSLCHAVGTKTAKPMPPLDIPAQDYCIVWIEADTALNPSK